MKHLCILGVLFATFASASVLAQDSNERARELYNVGTEAFEDGRFEEALESWEEAYELSDQAALLYNIGAAHDRLGHAADAVENYQAYLEDMPDADNRNYVSRRVEVLEAQLAERGGQDDEGVEPLAEAIDHVEEEVDTAEPEVAPVESSSGGPSAAAIVLTAVGGAMLVAGAGTGLAANGRYFDLEDTCPGNVCAPEQQEDIDGLTRMVRATDVLLIVGGVATLTGIIWLIASSGGDADEGQAIRLDVGPQSVQLTGRF